MEFVVTKKKNQKNKNPAGQVYKQQHRNTLHILGFYKSGGRLGRYVPATLHTLTLYTLLFQFLLSTWEILAQCLVCAKHC